MPQTKSVAQTFRAPERAAAGTFAGLAAIALAIMGLAGIFPRVILSVSTIALGAALLFHSGVVAARFAALVTEASVSPASSEPWRRGGMTIGFLAGASGIALGILALLNVAPMVLLPVAAILYGTALIMDSGLNARLSVLEAEQSAPALTRELARENASAAAGVQVLVGLGGITLGILALVSLPINTNILSLVAMLTIAAGFLLAGFLTGGRTFTVFRS